jgi:hypothetical protein
LLLSGKRLPERRLTKGRQRLLRLHLRTAGLRQLIR